VFEEENDRIVGFHLLLTLNQLFSYITWCGCFQGITIDKSVTICGTAILIFIFKQKKWDSQIYFYVGAIYLFEDVSAFLGGNSQSICHTAHFKKVLLLYK